MTRTPSGWMWGVGLSSAVACSGLTQDLGRVPAGGAGAPSAGMGMGGEEADGGGGTGEGANAPGGEGGSAAVGTDGGAGAGAGAGAGDAGGVAGDGGQPPMLNCPPGEVKLRAIADGSLRTFEYDAAGRLVYTEGPEYSDYTYTYDDQGRLRSQSSSDDEVGHTIRYGESGTVEYSNDDLSARSYMYQGKRLLEWTVHQAPGGLSPRFKYVPVWSDGLISSVVRHDLKEELPDVTETFTYELDELGPPVRMISSAGPSETPTTEVFDAQGRHLFQLRYGPEGEVSGVRLYRDNRDPVRSLLEPAAPPGTSSNAWLQADFEGEAEVFRYRPTWLMPPDDLMPWQPLTLSPEEAVDFARDVDGDGEIDVEAAFVFDETVRLTQFTLQLAGAPRLELQLSYAPGLTTYIETAPPSQRRYEARYYYGCDDFELPADP